MKKQILLNFGEMSLILYALGGLCQKTETFLMFRFTIDFQPWLKVSEEAVDAHITLKELGNYNHMFQKHTGVFNCPTFPESPKDIAHKLDEYFYGCRLGDYFKKE